MPSKDPSFLMAELRDWKVGSIFFSFGGVAKFGVEVAVPRPLEHAVVVFKGSHAEAWRAGETAFEEFKGGTIVGFELLN